MWIRLRCGRGASICWNQNGAPAAVRVDQVLLGAVAPFLVAEHGAPERQHLGNDERVHQGSVAASTNEETERVARASRRAGPADLCHGATGVEGAALHSGNGAHLAVARELGVPADPSAVQTVQVSAVGFAGIAAINGPTDPLPFTLLIAAARVDVGDPPRPSRRRRPAGAREGP